MVFKKYWHCELHDPVGEQLLQDTDWKKVLLLGRGSLKGGRSGVRVLSPQESPAAVVNLFCTAL